jgi:hypothetical protein
MRDIRCNGRPGMSQVPGSEIPVLLRLFKPEWKPDRLAGACERASTANGSDPVKSGQSQSNPVQPNQTKSGRIKLDQTGSGWIKVARRGGGG